MQRIILIAALATTISLRAQTITGYRWWLNDDVSTLVTAIVTSAPEVELNAALALPALTKDFNTITLQFKDSNDAWSVPETRLFTKSTGEVDAYEYWIDDAIANSTTNPIGPGNVVDLITDLPTGLPAGSYIFTIRFSGANGTWSVPLIAAFSSNVSVAELPGLTDVLIFPNPVTDQLGLRLNSDAARSLKLEVLDLSGAVVSDLNTWSVSGTTYRNWDISDLSSGNYMLRITGEHGAWTTRFVKP